MKFTKSLVVLVGLSIVLFAPVIATSSTVLAQADPPIVTLIKTFEELERNGEIKWFFVDTTTDTYLLDSETIEYATTLDYPDGAVCFSWSEDNEIIRSCVPHAHILEVTSVAADAAPPMVEETDSLEKETPAEAVQIPFYLEDVDAELQGRTADGAFILGDPDAPITIVTFMDFRCPHCQVYYPVTNQVIEELVLVGEARLEFRMMPTVDRTGFAFSLVECAAELQPDSFWKAQHVMFQIASQGWSQTSPQAFATQLDLDYDALLDCTIEAEQWRIDAQVAASAGVTGTPAVRIRLEDGELRTLSGSSGGVPFDVIQGAVQKAQ